MDEPRIIILSGPVDENSAMDVIVRLMNFDQEDNTREISLYINSPGGSIDYGLAIYDVIQHPPYLPCASAWRQAWAHSC